MTGDSTDIAARLRNLLPPWFADTNPVLNAFVTGASVALAFAYTLYAYAALQCRILTATGIFLDLIAQDFFGTSIARAAGQGDASFRATIIANLFRERATRRGITAVLTALTGYAPVIFEPFSPADTGVYGGAGIGYAVAGGYGSMVLPAQGFIIAYRPLQSGISNVAGYGITVAGYGAGQAEYASLDMLDISVPDSAIYAAIAAAKAEGTIMWVCIQNPPFLKLLATESSGLIFTESGQDILV